MSKKNIILNNNEYMIIENYKDGFLLSELQEKFTDYFYDYDYILGDWAYGKLRLKGFYESNNKKCNQINDIKNLKKYIKDNCAYDCRYFVIRKAS